MSKWQVAVYRNTCTADWSNQCIIFHVNHKDDWISTLHLVTFPEMKFLKPLHVCPLLEVAIITDLQVELY